jgi:hypothetical protein
VNGEAQKRIDICVFFQRDSDALQSLNCGVLREEI